MTGEIGNGPMARHAEGLAQGRILLSRCPRTGRHFFPPRSFAPGSADTPLDLVEASGNATLYSFTVVMRSPERGGPYNIALVELDEGPRLMSRITGSAPEDLDIGMRLKARIAVPDFGPAAAAQAPVIMFEKAHG